MAASTFVISCLCQCTLLGFCFRIKKQFKHNSIRAPEEIPRDPVETSEEDSKNIMEVMQWQAEAGISIGAAITATVAGPETHTFGGLRLDGMQGDHRDKRCMLTLNADYAGQFSYTEDRIAKWLAIASEARPALDGADGETGLAISEFLHSISSAAEVKKLNPVYLQSMGLMSERLVVPGGTSLTIDLEVHDTTISAEMDDMDELLVVTVSSTTFSLRKSSCSTCGEDAEIGWNIFKEVLKNRIDMCRVFRKIELEARSPNCNEGVANSGVTCQRASTVTVSQSSITVVYGAESVPKHIKEEQESIMHRAHNIFSSTNATEKTKVLAEDVEALIEDRSEDCLSGKEGIADPKCWQMDIPKGYAITFVGQSDIPDVILSVPGVVSKLEVMKKVRASDASGGHCTRKGGNTCLKAPAATCLEVPENPCSEGTGCFCQHADGTLFALAWAIDTIGLIIFGTIISGGHIQAGLFLAFHPPKFGMPGPTAFVIAGILNQIKLGGRLHSAHAIRILAR